MTQIQMRRDTATNWSSANPILASGEIGFETNTGKFKIGNGSSTWGALPYFQNISAHESAENPHDQYLQKMPTNIAEGVDLNTLTTTGVYYLGSSTGSTTTLNYPVDDWAGVIEVVANSTGYVMQRTTSIYSNPGSSSIYRNVWYRTRTAGVWQAWAPFEVKNSGVGSPNGIVAAPVGSRYTDTAATNGAVEWIKTSGTGSWGWNVSYGDTGWRDLSAYFVNGAGKGGAAMPPGGQEATRIRRVGAVVNLVASISHPTWVSGTPALEFPMEGFTNLSTYMPAGYATAAHAILAAGSLRIYTSAASAGQRYQWTWFTNDPWPTTLPGTPV